MNEAPATTCLKDYFEQSEGFFYFLADAGHHFVFTNPFFATTTGSGPLTGLFADPDRLLSILKQVSEATGPLHATLDCRQQDGSWIKVSWEFSCCMAGDPPERMVQAIGYALPASPANPGAGIGRMGNLFKAFEQSTEGMWRFDTITPVSVEQDAEDILAHWKRESFLADCNDNMARMYGYEKAGELIGTRLEQLIDFSDTARIANLRQFIENRFCTTVVETREFDRFGRVKYFLNRMEGVVVNGQLSSVWGTQQDITGQRLAEENLRKSEQFYRNLISESQDGIVLTDEKGIIVFAADSVQKVLGYEPVEVTGKTIFDFVHPDDIALAMGSFENELAFIKQSPFIHARLRNKQDQWVSCVVRGHNLVSNPGDGRIVIYFYDNTAGKKLMEELNRQAAALHNVFDLIITCDLQYHIQSWNQRAEQVVGYLEEEVKGKFLGDITQLDYSPFTAKEVADLLDRKGNWQGEITFLNREGVQKTILHTASFLLNEKGERVSIIGTGIDITEKKATAEQLKESELFYRSLFMNSLDGVLITGPDGVVKFASPSVTTIFGYSPEEIIGKRTFEFSHPDDRALAEEAFLAELREKPLLPFISVRIRNSQGNWIWCIVRGHNQLSNPHIRGMLVYLYDDTLRKQTEQALIESEKRFRTQAKLLSNVTDVIVTVDMNRVVTSWNIVVEKLTGISAGMAIGKPYREVISTSYYPFTNEQVFAIVQEEGIWRGEISFTGFDGKTKYLLHTISLLKDEKGEASGMMGVGKDITERKSMEAQLQQSENFYRSLASNSLDGIVLTDTTGKIIYCGPSVPHVSGYAVTDMLGKNIIEFVHPSDLRLAHEAFALELKRESLMNYVLLRLRHAKRGWVWCTVRAHNLLHDPILQGIVIYFNDDSKRKIIEDRLRESERRFRNLIYDLKLGVILQNERSEMLVCNKAALDMLGVTEDQLIGKTGFDPRWKAIREDGSSFPQQEHPVPQVIQHQQPVRDVVMGVYRPMTDDWAWLLVNAEPVFDEQEKLINVVCSFTDITEQKRMAQQLTEQEIQKQKLITQATIDGQEKERQEIGKELHDNINQHLTTTRLYLEVARDKAMGETREMIDLAEKNLAEIVKQIRNISQSLVPPTLGDIGLVESIQDLCDSLKRTHSFEISFQHRAFDENTLPENMKLMIFRIIQEQVNNIIRHARASRIRIALQSDAKEVRFSIRDNGQGFDPQQHKKGMGLKNIINRVVLFDGQVDIHSRPGEGCNVSVQVPARPLN